MELKFCDISGYRKQVRTLMRAAFPREERPPMWLLEKRCRQGRAEFYAVTLGRQFVGLSYVIGNDRVKTLMFLAVDDKARGGGYGTEILSAVHDRYRDVKLFLNIEPLVETAPNYEQRCRRKAFYERNGMSLLDYQVREAGVTYEMMTFGEYVTKEEYAEVMRVMYGKALYALVRRM